MRLFTGVWFYLLANNFEGRRSIRECYAAQAWRSWSQFPDWLSAWDYWPR